MRAEVGTEKEARGRKDCRLSYIALGKAMVHPKKGEGGTFCFLSGT
jgi:hypothetical protein